MKKIMLIVVLALMSIGVNAQINNNDINIIEENYYGTKNYIVINDSTVDVILVYDTCKVCISDFVTFRNNKIYKIMTCIKTNDKDTAIKYKDDYCNKILDICKNINYTIKYANDSMVIIDNDYRYISYMVSPILEDINDNWGKYTIYITDYK
jgi:hypothetical protein